MLQNCNPLVCAAPLSPISPCREFSVPRSLLLALPSSQAITPWATQTCYCWWHFARIKPRTSLSCCINLYAHTTPLSAQIAEWYVHKDLCYGLWGRRPWSGSTEKFKIKIMCILHPKSMGTVVCLVILLMLWLYDSVNCLYSSDLFWMSRLYLWEMV